MFLKQKKFPKMQLFIKMYIPYNSALLLCTLPQGKPILIHRSFIHYYYYNILPIGGTSKLYLLAGTKIIGSISSYLVK